MKVLVAGAGGMLGREVTAACHARRHDVVALARPALDITDPAAVERAISDYDPDVVINCAGFTDVDGAEDDEAGAMRVNDEGAALLASAAAAIGAKIVYISSDYVFDGTKPDAYVEWDAPSPASVYGRSKLGGEWEVDGGSATIVRTSWVCGRHGSNMVKTILRLAGEHEKLAFVDDQRGQPSFADDLAPMIRRLVVERRPGLFHVTNQGAVSWFEFARTVLEAAGLDPGRVRPIPTADLDPPRPAPRPVNSVLDNAALRLSGLPLLPHYRHPLERLVGQLAS